MKLELNTQDMLTLGGMDQYRALDLTHADGTVDKPGVDGASYVLIVKRGTPSSDALDAHFQPTSKN